MAEKGKEKGLLSAESCRCSKRFYVLIVKKISHLLFFTLHKTVGIQLLCFWFILKLLLFLVFVMLAVNQLIASE